MNILIDRPALLTNEKLYIVIEDEYITYVGADRPDKKYDRVISGFNKLALPGLYNNHTHVPMTLFRGYAENMPLIDWLHKKIFPAEEKLDENDVYIAAKFAVAEMIKNGIVSFTDMYNFSDKIAEAVCETGIKANISRAMLSFDDEEDYKLNYRFIEACNLFRDYHNKANGRIKIDMSLHAEYTNKPNFCAYIAEYTKSIGARMHIHLSETLGEHNGCIERYGKTPAEFFYGAGIFDVPTVAAHCVFVSDSDMEILRTMNVSVAHNPVSNLKLGSGIMKLQTMLDKGINVTFGTDGCASNNTHDILKEMYVASILHKGIHGNPYIINTNELFTMATINGAVSQGREACGKIEAGYKADLILVDMDNINNIPSYDMGAVIYCIKSGDVCLTMTDGKVLYESGEFKTLDIERLKYDMRDISAKKYGARN